MCNKDVIIPPWCWPATARGTVPAVDSRLPPANITSHHLVLQCRVPCRTLGRHMNRSCTCTTARVRHLLGCRSGTACTVPWTPSHHTSPCRRSSSPCLLSFLQGQPGMQGTAPAVLRPCPRGSQHIRYVLFRRCIGSNAPACCCRKMCSWSTQTSMACAGGTPGRRCDYAPLWRKQNTLMLPFLGASNLPCQACRSRVPWNPGSRSIDSGSGSQLPHLSTAGMPVRTPRHGAACS